MDFDYESFAPAAPALSVPYASGVSQPPALPTTLFGGSIPAVQFPAVTPIQAAAIAALHGPAFRPIYEAGLVHPHTQPNQVHAIVGVRFDRRG